MNGGEFRRFRLFACTSLGMRASVSGVGAGLDPETESAIVLSVAGLLVAVYGTMAGASLLSAGLHHGRWQGIPAKDHLLAVVRLPWHLSNPAGGYPTAMQSRLAGPGWWWSCAAAIGLSLAAVVWFGVSRWSTRRPRRGWAKRSDLRHLRRTKEHRVILGVHERCEVTLEERHSLLVVGPTQTGKSTGLAIPAIVEADDLAVVALSVKGDLVEDTLCHRTTLSGCHWIFDPTGVLRPPSGPVGERPGSPDDIRRLVLRGRMVQSGWSPLQSTSTWQGALEAAHDLARAGASASASADGDNKFFYDSAEALLACYLYAAANSASGSMRTIVRWIARHENDEVAHILDGLESREASEHFAGIHIDDKKTLSNIFSTARLLVSAWLDPTVAASSDRSDIIPSLFFDGKPNTLYLVAPPSNQERLRVVFNMIVKQFVDHAFATVLATGRPLQRKVLFVLDELANAAPIPNLGGIASTAASQGIQLMSLVQDISQLNDRYGRDTAGTIVGNHRALLLLPGGKDLATLEMASKLLGSHEQTNTSITRDGTGRRSRTENQREMPLAPIEQLRLQRKGTGILIYGNVPGATLKLRPWYEDNGLSRKVRHVPPGDGPINPLPPLPTKTDATVLAGVS
jgi:type IV secretion system protein VirD4